MHISFEIDWLVVIGTAFNLLLLYIIFKRYLFGPLVKTIETKKKEWEEREKKLKAWEEELKKREEELKIKAIQLQQEMEEFKKRVMEEVEETRKKLMEEAEKKANTLYNHILNAAYAEATKIREEAERHIRQLLEVSTKEVLSNFMGSESEMCLTEILIKRFEGDIRQFAKKVGDNPVYMELPWYTLPDEESYLIGMLKDLGVNVVAIKTNPEILAGFRLVFQDYVFDATLNRYVEEAVGGKKWEL